MRELLNARSVHPALRWSAAACGLLILAHSAWAQPPVPPRPGGAGGAGNGPSVGAPMPTIGPAERGPGPRGPLAPSPRLKAKVDDLIEDISNTEAELEVQLRRSKLVRTRYDILRVAVSDPTIVEIVPFGTREVDIIGKTTGSTSMTLWMGNPQQPPRVLSLLVTVTADTAVEEKRKLAYADLQQMVNEMFPDSKVQIIPVADKVIVRGQARDAEDASRIMAVIRGNADNSGGGFSSGGFGTGVAQGTAANPYPDAIQLPASGIISMLQVPHEHQVMLKVRIAELKRSAVRRFGARFNFKVDDFDFNQLVGGGGSALLTGTFSGGDSFQLFIEALAQNGVAKILAEPTLVTLSGRPATFLSGGEFAVPTVVGVGGVQAVSTTFKGFGTSLTFTPTVLDKDRIRLQVVPTFSTLNSNNSVGGVFGLDTRTTSTTVDMREGQVFAIAGLIQEQYRGDKSRLPFFGDIPLVGTFFSSQATSRDESELIVLVTPELVRPMEPEQVPALLPGMDVTEPDDIEFFIKRRIEGRPNCHHRSTVWYMYREKIANGDDGSSGCQQTQSYYLNGQHGYSN